MAMQQGNTAAVLGTMTVPTNDFDNAYTYFSMSRCMCAHAFACANPVFPFFCLCNTIILNIITSETKNLS